MVNDKWFFIFIGVVMAILFLAYSKAEPPNTEETQTSALMQKYEDLEDFNLVKDTDGFDNQYQIDWSKEDIKLIDCTIEKCDDSVDFLGVPDIRVGETAQEYSGRLIEYINGKTQ